MVQAVARIGLDEMGADRHAVDHQRHEGEESGTALPCGSNRHHVEAITDIGLTPAHPLAKLIDIQEYVVQPLPWPRSALHFVYRPTN